MSYYPGAGGAQAQQAIQQMHIAEIATNEALSVIQRANTISWESPAAQIFRTWLTNLVAEVSRTANSLATQSQQIPRG